jgi:hypothetical protein
MWKYWVRLMHSVRTCILKIMMASIVAYYLIMLFTNLMRTGA